MSTKVGCNFILQLRVACSLTIDQPRGSCGCTKLDDDVVIYTSLQILPSYRHAIGGPVRALGVGPDVAHGVHSYTAHCIPNYKKTTS